MRSSSLILRCAVGAAALAILAPLSTLAQTFIANTGTEAVINTTPLPNVSRVTVPGGHKAGAEKLLYGRVREGVYTVDGMVAKVQLNYDVNGVKYLYLFVPGIGTALVSANPYPDAVNTQAKLVDNVLSFNVDEHRFNLTGIALASDKGSAPEHLYVKLDRTAWHLNRRPMIGFGSAAQMPYQWPGAIATQAAAQPVVSYAVPPVPTSLLPSTRSVTPSSAPAPAPAQPSNPTP